MDKIEVKESSLEEATAVNSEIPEFENLGKEHFEERIAGKENIVFAAEIAGKKAGYLIAYDKFCDKSIYCWMAAVAPEFRRKGALKAMMKELEKWAGEKGYKKIKIKTRNSRREMLSYLVKEGFYFIGVEERETVEENRILAEKRI